MRSEGYSHVRRKFNLIILDKLNLDYIDSTQKTSKFILRGGVVARVLIVDNEPENRKILADMIQGMDMEPLVVGTLTEALSQGQSHTVDVVRMDVWLPDGNAIQTLPRFLERRDDPEVIIYSNLGDSEGAELAMTSGAWDYLDKGADQETIRHTVQRALQYRRERLHEGGSEEDTAWAATMGILGQSKSMKHCLVLADKAAKTEVVAYITGETGTGKGLLARAIHERSNRARKPFVVVDCASLPKNLGESVLCGYGRGAITGATMPKTGLVALADGGTLFLDEVGELPLGAQGAFLRVLQERRFRPVGSEQEKTADFRLIVATNRNLEQMVREGSFRQDLLYRINAWRIELPPLRDRDGDALLLARRFIDVFCRKSQLPKKTLAPEFLEVIRRYDWPGNVRELVNTLESVITFAGDAPTLHRMHLPRDLVARQMKFPKQSAEADTVEDEFLPPSWKNFREDVLHRAEQEYFKNLLAFVNNEPGRAIKISGLSKSQFYKILKKNEKFFRKNSVSG